jgi:hypothetical protein
LTGLSRVVTYLLKRLSQKKKKNILEQKKNENAQGQLEEKGGQVS